MGTAIVLLILVVVVIFSIRGYLKKTRYGCCGSGGGEQRVKPDDRNPAHFPYEYEVGVDGMKCQNCAIRVENAFHERDGFLAKVNLKENCAVNSREGAGIGGRAPQNHTEERIFRALGGNAEGRMKEIFRRRIRATVQLAEL